MARRTSRSPRDSSHHETKPQPAPGRYPIDTGDVVLSREPGPPEHWLLGINGVPSSAVCPQDPAWLGFEYLEFLRISIDLLHGDRPLVAVHLGGAGCALPWALDAGRPGCRQVVVEIDATLAALVRQWFALPRSPALRLRVGDARAELAGMRAESADVIVRDVFDGDQTPVHLQTAEFLTDVRRVLRPQGWYLANIADRPPLRTLRAEINTAREVFETVGVIAETSVVRGRRYGNAILIGGSGALSVADLGRALARTGLTLTVVHGDRLNAFSGHVPAIRDPAPPPPEVA